MLIESQLAQPWRESAARLGEFLELTADEERCLAVLNLLCRRFGDHGYPGFLKLLLIVGESGNGVGKQRLSEAMALGLRRGDVPSGVLTSWGATRFWTAQQPLHAGMLPGNSMGVAPRRQLDPLAYLTVWFCQRTHRPYLSEPTYRTCVARLVELFNSSSTARQLYPLKIEADLTGIEGAFTRQTRQRLAALADSWKRGLTIEQVASAAAESAGHSGEP
ncbi:MAG: hypothetical protein ACJ8R9_23245 [Steroidobacteraceae bacterium]